MPLKNQLHVSQLLSNVSVQYKNEAYIAEKVFPVVPVAKDIDLYRVYGRNFRIPETKRAPKALANQFSFEVSTSSYLLEQHALKDYIGVDESENYDFGGLQVDSTEYLTDAIMRRMEKSVADLFTTTSWSLNVSLAAANAFSANTTVSDPIPIFQTGCATVIANSGVTPNEAIIPYNTMNNIKNHVSVLDRIKYTSAEVDAKILGALIGVPEIHVPTSVYDSADEGVASSITNFFSGFCWLGWKPGSPGRKTPSSGYIFQSSKPRVRTWFDDERNADVVEVEVKYDAKVVGSLTGYLIKGV